MGLTYATIELENARTNAKMPVKCLVDTGALHLCIPEHVAIQLGFDLDNCQHREVTLADGSRRRVPYAGPLLARFANRSCFIGALVLGNEPLLGAIPMEDMDLVVLPSTRQLAVNPDNPNMAASVVKHLH
ncbi:MAG TPA: aspartyl protease family protein [Phycisphaerales bacterium]|nr:aspartyl protease family protein [Phycisphaerales bacterium]